MAPFHLFIQLFIYLLTTKDWHHDSTYQARIHTGFHRL